MSGCFLREQIREPTPDRICWGGECPGPVGKWDSTEPVTYIQIRQRHGMPNAKLLIPPVDVNCLRIMFGLLLTKAKIHEGPLRESQSIQEQIQKPVDAGARDSDSHYRPSLVLLMRAQQFTYRLQPNLEMI